MIQAHIIVFGFVQGVGYRKFVKQEARKRNITGWARNLTDGSVEAILIGDKRMVEEVIDLCKKGPFLSQVDNIHVEWEEPQEEFTEFFVRHA